jgi:transcriptional regulator with XRE-family HTH domain
MTQEAYSKQIGDWILAERDALSISQAELAAHVGVSQQAIATWEKGASSISAYSHAKLRAFFKQQRSLRAGGSEVARG